MKINSNKQDAKPISNNDRFDSYIIAFNPGTNEFFITNQRCFYWEDRSIRCKDPQKMFQHFCMHLDHYYKIQQQLQIQDMGFDLNWITVITHDKKFYTFKKTPGNPIGFWLENVGSLDCDEQSEAPTKDAPLEEPVKKEPKRSKVMQEMLDFIADYNEEHVDDINDEEFIDAFTDKFNLVTKELYNREIIRLLTREDHLTIVPIPVVQPGSTGDVPWWAQRGGIWC